MRTLYHIVLLLALAPGGVAPAAPPTTIRVATFNLEDVRTSDLTHADNPRLKAAAEIIQRIRPNILFLNEIAYDTPEGPDVEPDAPPGRNADRFVRHYLSVPQAPGLKPITYNTFMARPNTGFPSGHDLDRSGEVVTAYPDPGRSDASGAPPPQTDEGRAFGADAWGFGTFPGQFAMALLVDPRLTIRREEIRTFRLFPWAYMPGALRPIDPETGRPWYDEDVADRVRLSSKSHWDVPVELPGGAVVHLLCAHPTPPAFDGPEGRNKRRNHDEIRFWADYIEDAEFIIDDAGHPGGLTPGEHFVIVGDLNADPDEGSSLYNPVGRLLLASRRLADAPAPTSDVQIDRLDPDDTARFGLRVDYVLPSATLEVARSGVWRHPPAGREFPSDHFPVWADIRVPTPPPDQP